MAAPLALRLVTYLLVGDGIAALHVAGLIGPLGALLVAGAILGSWWLERARERGTLRPPLAWGLVGTAAAAIAVDLAYLAQSLLDGMVHLLLFLILLRLFMHRTLRDLRDAGFLSFFLLVAAASVTSGAAFLFVFVVYVLLGTWMLMLHHLVAESERAARPGSPAAPVRIAWRSPLARVSLAAAAATFAVAGILFFVIPRVGQATLPFRSGLGRMVTGFTDKVELGAYGEIESDRTVIMRVHFPEERGDPSRLPNLRWRGIAFDHFTGHSWTTGRGQRILLRRSTAGDFGLGPARAGRGPIVRQEIYLDPIGTDIIFAAPHVLRMELRAGTVSFDDMGAVAVATATARLRYIADSQLELTPPPGTRVAGAGTAFTTEERARYLQLPRLAPLIPGLAREVTAGARDPWDAALRLTQFLSTRYRYTLALKRDTALEPLEEFLFVRRSGNCEYFAASLAVMLRSLDIPARVVGGFQRGEWNPYGRYFMVRLADAHSWVEAYFDGLGWVALDPSPRAEAEPERGALALYLDAMRMRWYRHVINWSLRDQVLVASTIQRRAEGFRLALAWPRAWPGRPWLWGAGALAAGALAAWLGWRLGWAPGAGAPGARMPRFYARALRRLARRGLEPGPAETARQFCARVEAEAPPLGQPFARLTRAYERARFGAAAPDAQELRELEGWVEALSRR